MSLTDPSQESRAKIPRRDPFRTLALTGIILGMVIVTGATVFWGLTGRSSSLIIGAGIALSIGAPLSERFGDATKRLGDLVYYQQRDGTHEDGPRPTAAPERRERKARR